MKIQQKKFSEIDSTDRFFDTLRKSYKKFDPWFNSKSDETAFVVYDMDSIVAFMYLKIEDESENYSDMRPMLKPKRRIKIGTLKVSKTGVGIGTRFMEIIKETAKNEKASEIYITVLTKDSYGNLVEFLDYMNFEYFASKKTSDQSEDVYVLKIKEGDGL